MIRRAVAAGIPFGWVTADEAYGDNGPLRAFLEEQGLTGRPEISLVIRRFATRPSEPAFCLCHTPQ